MSMRAADAMRLPAALNLGALLGRNAPPSHPTLVFDGRTLRLGALDRAADAVARLLHADGIGAGSRATRRVADRVAIVSSNRPEVLPIMFGALRAGCTVVPVNPRQPPQTTHAVLDEVRPARVFVEREHAVALPASATAVEIEALALGLDGDNARENDVDTATARRHAPFEPAAVGDDDLAEILYTSGSTGQPRGVPLTHRGQIWFLNAFLDATGWAPEVALVAAPLFHMNALIRVKCALATGGRIVLQKRFSPEAYLSAIAMHRVTLLTGVPTMYAMLLEHRELLRDTDTSSVTRVMMGSGAAAPDLVAALQRAFPCATIGVAYGLTEAGGTVSSTLVHAPGEVAPSGSVGKPLPGVELRFGNPNHTPDASDGVLYLRSPATARGYFQRPDATAARFRDGWLKSDDVLARDTDGWLYFHGRADDMYVCGGENVYPAQLEQRLLSHPDVAQAVVVAVPDRIRGQAAYAFVVLREGAALGARELQAHVAADAPSHLHAHHLRILASMPLAGTAKVDLAHLRRIANEDPTLSDPR
jgi:acyl-CoA synthetase (AMP-forming)/AMP-acid ligase II